MRLLGSRVTALALVRELLNLQRLLATFPAHGAPLLLVGITWKKGLNIATSGILLGLMDSITTRTLSLTTSRVKMKMV